MAPRDMVLVGRITGAHGIRGEVKLTSFTAEPKAIAVYSPLETAKGAKLEIARLRAQKDSFIAVLRGVTDRNAAEALKGVELFVPRERLPKPEDDEVYVHDLVGLPVYDGDKPIGKVVGVANFGASDLLDVELPGREDTVFIPFAESYIVSTDGERIVVSLPEGFLEPTA
jgi:16S rRNA processing protein RimM